MMDTLPTEALALIDEPMHPWEWEPLDLDTIEEVEDESLDD